MPEEAAREAEEEEAKNQNCFSVPDFSKDKNINRQFMEVEDEKSIFFWKGCV